MNGSAPRDRTVAAIGYEYGPDGTARELMFTPARTRTPTGGNLATCPRTLATAGTIRERLDRLARFNRDASAKLAALRIDNARLSATIASARKNTRTTIPARVSTAAARKSAAVLAEPPRFVIGPMGITADPDYIPTPTAPPRRMRIGPFGIYEEND